MLLRSLEMQGFKSFPDKTELNFGKGITAVVGPNGSGKSNISDAVRWVLGETSTKSLRGSKMEDVIFGGTSKRKALGFAQVMLTLDNSDGTLKDHGEIVTVTRRYYRSGESEYKIDGESVRRKDIHELFMDTGLGSDGYSMVGQGKIDSIISAKNEDRRELFEEAAGISRFRHKRKDAERRLEQAQENLVRLLDILGELESRVGPLKKQSEKAQKFLEYSEEKKTLEIGVWLNKINRFTVELREQEHKIDAVRASYEVSENDLAAIEKELEEVAEKVTSINLAIEQSRLGASGYEEEALRKDGEISVLNATLEHNNETIERLTADITDADGTGATIDEQIEAKNKIIAENEKLIADKKAELESVANELSKVQNENMEISDKTVELNQMLTALTIKLSDSKVKMSQATSSIDEINSRKDTIASQIEATQKDIDYTQSQADESNKNLELLKERIDEYENSLGGYQMKVDAKKQKAEKIKQDAERLARQMAEKSDRARVLEDLEKNMEGFSGAVKAVLKQSQSKALPGIHGTLSQLITVDNENSTAIEIALGAAMQNVVVSTESDAKRAINYLKQNNVGRATFLPISAIKPRYMDEKNLDDNFGFVDVASNLVDCDEQYRDIVENLLGRVMVVEDIDCAIAISKKYKNRYKIVTLDGQVMNPGGSMSGGSKGKGSGVLSRANLIEELKSEAQKIGNELKEVQAELKKAVEDANSAVADLQGADADLRNAKEEYIRAEGDAKLISDKLQSFINQRDTMCREQENSEGRILLFNQAVENAKQEAAEIEKQMADTEAELNNVSTGAKELSSKRDKIREKTEQINLELVTLTKDSEAARLSVEELELRKSTQSDRVKNITDEINEIKAKNENLMLSINDVKAQADELRQKASESNDAVTQKIDDRNELEKRSNELRAKEKATLTDKEKLSGDIVRLEERKANMKKEYDELGDMLFEQYELTKPEAQALGIVIDDMAEAKKRLHEIKVAIRGLGSINVGAIEEYKEVSERYNFLKEQTDDIEQSKKELAKIIDDLTSSMSEKFMTQFNKINTEFKTCFADFFGGGNGEIILEEPDNCLESAIEIKIQPPGKSVQNINLFSGGEKSLAAMALLFSVLKVQPSPFCIYDEVEAALDDVNVERFAKYMRRMTDKTQFISITHRRGTMEEADVLYGVTMQEKGVSKLLELQSAELAQQMGLEA
ncbi:chromosome segregation protein SMC [Eubacterium coprostanoligenes]|uniref:chromosome segregation protein SMC n=1 Tax=Eubacterium coprostanoligenes TaxID=290054 RepID=UPI0023567F91|nr:chromosome segregation protein SMC [Eubacterium coprostanoligenes]MCI6253271.1 chromosome segregation protein SMC [Eubacterium coprostanoligenes]MDY5400391.1 chromosome segregation protein SMC [Eubacterium coprostanoligenes]